jgi:hypothetical protein
VYENKHKKKWNHAMNFVLLVIRRDFSNNEAMLSVGIGAVLYAWMGSLEEPVVRRMLWD